MLRAALEIHRSQEREGEASPTKDPLSGRQCWLLWVLGKEQAHAETWLAGKAADAQGRISLHPATAMGTWVIHP